MRVWPEGHPETNCVDQFRLRFLRKDGSTPITQQEVLKLAEEVHALGFDITGTEHLYAFDGSPGFSTI